MKVWNDYAHSNMTRNFTAHTTKGKLNKLCDVAFYIINSSYSDVFKTIMKKPLYLRLQLTANSRELKFLILVILFIMSFNGLLLLLPFFIVYISSFFNGWAFHFVLFNGIYIILDKMLH